MIFIIFFWSDSLNWTEEWEVVGRGCEFCRFAFGAVHVPFSILIDWLRPQRGVVKAAIGNHLPLNFNMVKKEDSLDIDNSDSLSTHRPGFTIGPSLIPNANQPGLQWALPASLSTRHTGFTIRPSLVPTDYHPGFTISLLLFWVTDITLFLQLGLQPPHSYWSWAQCFSTLQFFLLFTCLKQKVRKMC